MLQKLLQSVSQPFREVFGVIFKWWLFIFVTILVPLDFLYRYSVLVSTLPPLQIVASFSSIVIFFTIFALIISLLSLVAVRVCTKFSLNGAELVNEANAFLGILFVGII